MAEIENLNDVILQIGRRAKNAADTLKTLSSQKKNEALSMMAESLRKNEKLILAANTTDLENAKQKNLSKAMLDRLKLTSGRIETMAQGLLNIAQLPNPVNRVLSSWDVPSGLSIDKVSIPLGVIAVIYESRPNVTADAAALCFKSGNAVILRGGSEAEFSNKAIHQALAAALVEAELPIDCIQFIPIQDRQAIQLLLQLDEYIDVIVPRGGPALIKNIKENSNIPLFMHLDGICHTYIHQSADLEKAIKIIVNAKMRRTGICGATETVLIDSAIIKTHAPAIIQALLAANCEVRVDEHLLDLDKRLIAATEKDWCTEYLDAIISIKTVKNINEAIEHIRQYSSSHTDAILAENPDAVKQFFAEVGSAIVMHNASTQFADGGEFGMGAEIGIATGKLHARGPVGLEQLTTFQYQVRGHGTIRP